MSSLILVGANHKVAPIEIREKLAIPKARLPEALLRLISTPGIHEAYILSTCNRTEIYTAGESQACRDGIHALLSDMQEIPLDKLRPCLYDKEADHAVLHMFSVAAGLDSMILGEVQILGQIRESFATASELDTVGKQLDTMLRKALEAGKKARTDTEISSHAASVSHAGVELAKRIFGDITRSMVLIIGAGEMGELLAQNLVDNGVKGTIFVNRTLAKAEELAQRFKGLAAPFDQLAAQLRVADVVISSTDAPTFVVDRAMVQSVLHTRKGRPLFFIDLAVPRDIEPSIHKLGGAYLYNIDDLQAVVEANMSERAKEIIKVREILAEEVARFMSWHAAQTVSPTISALRQKAEEIRLGELAKMNAKLGQLSEEQQNAINALTLAIINKLLHPPTTNLKVAATNGKGRQYVETLQELFDLRLE